MVIVPKQLHKWMVEQGLSCGTSIDETSMEELFLGAQAFEAKYGSAVDFSKHVFRPASDDEGGAALRAAVETLSGGKPWLFDLIEGFMKSVMDANKSGVRVVGHVLVTAGDAKSIQELMHKNSGEFIAALRASDGACMCPTCVAGRLAGEPESKYKH